MTNTIPDRIYANLSRHAYRPFLGLLDSQGLCQQGAYAAVVQKTLNWIELYRSRGLGKGDRVIVILPHGLEAYVAYLGAVLGGLVPTFFAFPSTKLSKAVYFETVHQLIQSAGARLVVTYPELAQDLKDLLRSKGEELPVCTVEELPEGNLQTLAKVAVSPDEIAFLQYSSGTTGLKKGVGITHQALLWQVDHYSKALGLNSKDLIVSWLPLYHDMGLVACYWLPLLTATPLVAMSPFDWVKDPRMLLEQITQVKATLCWMPNFAYHHLTASIPDPEVARYDLSSLRGVINCSEPITASAHQRFAEKFRVAGFRPEALWTCYAMAENTFAVTSGRFPLEVVVDPQALAKEGRVTLRSGGKRLVSSGGALPDTEVRVVDENQGELGEDRVGEIVIRSPCLMKGYDHAVHGELQEGWFYTGDLGFFHRGELFVTGRKKDLIIVAGKNLYPQDIEEVVSEIEGVLPGRCVALGAYDEEAGTEHLVVLAETEERDPHQLAALEMAIRRQVAAATEVVAGEVYLVPSRWLRKSSSGKLSRAENLKRFREEQPQLTFVGEEGDNECPRARAVVARALSPERVQGLPSDQNLLTTGVVDSLSLVRLMLEIEKEVGGSIPVALQRDVTSFETLRKIEEVLERLPGFEREEAPSISQSDREKKSAAFAALREGVELLILGSSRVDGLSARVAGENGIRAFNFSVSAAMAEDWYCILCFCLEHQPSSLRRLWLGMDIEAFNGQYAPDKRLASCPVLRHYLDREDHEALEALFPADQGMAETLKSLTGSERQRFQSLLKGLREQGAIRHDVPTDYEAKTGDLKFLDSGVLQTAYDKRLSLCLDGLRTVDDLGHQERQMDLRLKNFHSLNPRRVGYFEKVVELCRQKQIALICFLSPMHPLMKQAICRRTPYLARVEELKALCSKLGVELRDYSEPLYFGGNELDFRDEAHMGPFNSDQLLAHLMSADFNRHGRRLTSSNTDGGHPTP